MPNPETTTPRPALRDHHYLRHAPKFAITSRESSRDLTCREQVDYAARKAQVIHNAQLAFVADHLSELQAYQSAIAQGQTIRQ
jgi:hypothetical protein